MHRLAGSFLILCFVLIGCASRSGEETALRLRLSEYEKNWANQRYDEVWRMMSQSLSDANGDEGNQFVDFIRRSEAAPVRLEIEKVRIDGEKATVRAKVTVGSTTGQDSRQEMQEQEWVKLNDQWFFTKYRSVE